MSERDIQKTILDGLAAMRIFAFRLNTASFVGEHKGKKRFFKSHSLGPGAADILAIRQIPWNALGWKGTYSLPLWIEVKAPGGRQSPEQESFQRHVEAEGHRYLVASSWESVLAVIQGS